MRDGTFREAMGLQLNYRPPPRRRSARLWFWSLAAALVVTAAVVWAYCWVGAQGVPTPGH
jgi:hypothetical protein